LNKKTSQPASSQLVSMEPAGHTEGLGLGGWRNGPTMLTSGDGWREGFPPSLQTAIMCSIPSVGVGGGKVPCIPLWIMQDALHPLGEGVGLDPRAPVPGPGSVGPGPRARVCGPGGSSLHAIVTSYKYTDNKHTSPETNKTSPDSKNTSLGTTNPNIPNTSPDIQNANPNT